MDDPITQIQVVSTGKNASDTFSTGVVLSITCGEGHRLNVGNRTVKCNKRGLWKPDRPACLLSKFRRIRNPYMAGSKMTRLHSISSMRDPGY